MKKLVFILLLFPLFLLGQVTPSGEYRIATQSDQFGVNLPMGTKIFCVADSTYWVLTTIAGTTETLATCNKLQLNDGGTGTNYWTFVDSATDTLKNNVAMDGVVAIKGNLNLQTTTSTVGQINQNGYPIFHTYYVPGTPGYNYFLGYNTGNFTLTGASGSNGSHNVGIGGFNLNNLTTGFQNIAIGYLSLSSLMNGYGNVSIGENSNWTMVDGLYNTSVGNSASYNNKGSNNTAIGHGALFSNVANTNSVAIGNDALANADNRVSGRVTYNTAVGYQSMYGSGTAANNTGRYNTAVGYQTLVAMTSGSYNTVFGVDAGGGITTGSNNNAYGYSALKNNTTGTNNSAFGDYALETNVANRGNVAFGNYALQYANSTSTFAVSLNSAFGYSALIGSAIPANNTGLYNTAIGGFSLSTNTSGSNNISIGKTSGGSNTTGSENIYIGCYAGYSNTTGRSNIFIGDSVAYNETGSNKLYIENSNADSTNALIFGNFSIDRLTINGDLKLPDIDSASTSYALYYNKSTNLVTYDSSAMGGNGAGDNLGNHTADTTLDMSNENIIGVDTASISDLIIGNDFYFETPHTDSTGVTHWLGWREGMVDGRIGRIFPMSFDSLPVNAEEDPIYAGDSSNIFWFKDTSSLAYQNYDSQWRNNINDSLVANSQGFLQSEVDGSVSNEIDTWTIRDKTGSTNQMNIANGYIVVFLGDTNINVTSYPSSQYAYDSLLIELNDTINVSLARIDSIRTYSIMSRNMMDITFTTTKGSTFLCVQDDILIDNRYPSIPTYQGQGIVGDSIYAYCNPSGIYSGIIDTIEFNGTTYTIKIKPSCTCNDYFDSIRIISPGVKILLDTAIHFIGIDSARTDYNLYYDKLTGIVTYDSAGIGGIITETDPYYATDSANIFWFKDTSNLAYHDYSNQWRTNIGDSLTANNHGFLTEEDDPIWISDSSDYAMKSWVNAALTQYIYDPDASIVTRGTVQSGTVNTLDVHDNVNWVIAEQTGGVGFNIQVIFDSVDQEINRVWFHGNYNGNHTCDIEVYNYDNTVWESYTTLQPSAYPEWIEFSLPDADEHKRNDSVKIRFYHSNNGAVNDKLYLDYLALVKTGFGSADQTEFDPIFSADSSRIFWFKDTTELEYHAYEAQWRSDIHDSIDGLSVSETDPIYAADSADIYDFPGDWRSDIHDSISGISGIVEEDPYYAGDSTTILGYPAQWRSDIHDTIDNIAFTLTDTITTIWLRGIINDDHYIGKTWSTGTTFTCLAPNITYGIQLDSSYTGFELPLAGDSCFLYNGNSFVYSAIIDSIYLMVDTTYKAIYTTPSCYYYGTGDTLYFKRGHIRNDITIGNDIKGDWLPDYKRYSILAVGNIDAVDSVLTIHGNDMPGVIINVGDSIIGFTNSSTIETITIDTVYDYDPNSNKFIYSYIPHGITATFDSIWIIYKDTTNILTINSAIIYDTILVSHTIEAKDFFYWDDDKSIYRSGVELMEWKYNQMAINIALYNELIFTSFTLPNDCMNNSILELSIQYYTEGGYMSADTMIQWSCETSIDRKYKCLCESYDRIYSLKYREGLEEMAVTNISNCGASSQGLTSIKLEDNYLYVNPYDRLRFVIAIQTSVTTNLFASLTLKYQSIRQGELYKK